MPRAPITDYSAVDRLRATLQQGTESLRRQQESDFNVSQQILQRGLARQQAQFKQTAAERFREAVSPSTMARLKGVAPEDARTAAIDQYTGALLGIGDTQGAAVAERLHDKPTNPPSIQSDWSDVLDEQGQPQVKKDPTSGTYLKRQHKIDLRNNQPIPNVERWNPLSSQETTMANWWTRQGVQRVNDLQKERAERMRQAEDAFQEASKYQPITPDIGKKKGMTAQQVRDENNRLAEVRRQTIQKAEAATARIQEIEKEMAGFGAEFAPYKKRGGGVDTTGAGGAGKEPKELDEATALKILDEAGGDVKKAEKIATERGYKVE